MQELQAIATFVLTGAVALLVLVLLAGAVVAVALGIRLARTLEATAAEVLRATRALADATEGVGRMVRRAEGGLAEVRRTFRRLAFLERILEKRLARLVIMAVSMLEGARTAWRMVRQVMAARMSAEAAGEEETADVG